MRANTYVQQLLAVPVGDDDVRRTGVNAPFRGRAVRLIRKRHIAARGGANPVVGHVAPRLGVLNRIITVVQLRDAPKGRLLTGGAVVGQLQGRRRGGNDCACGEFDASDFVTLTRFQRYALSGTGK